MIITNSRYALVGYFITSYPTRAHGIIVIYTKTPELAACAVEMNLTWKLIGTERLTLYYDSVEELGQLACFKCLFFCFEQE